MDGRELKLYRQRLAEAQFLRDENRFLRGERDQYRKSWYYVQQRVNTLEERTRKLQEENRRLRQQVRELTAAAQQSESRDPSPAIAPRPQAGPYRGAAACAGTRRRASGRAAADRWAGPGLLSALPFDPFG